MIHIDNIWYNSWVLNFLMNKWLKTAISELKSTFILVRTYRQGRAYLNYFVFNNCFREDFIWNLCLNEFNFGLNIIQYRFLTLKNAEIVGKKVFKTIILGIELKNTTSPVPCGVFHGTLTPYKIVPFKVLIIPTPTVQIK